MKPAVQIEERSDCIEITGSEADRAAFRNIITQAKSMPIYAGGVPELSQLRQSAARFAESSLARPMLPDVDVADVRIADVAASWFRPRNGARAAPLLYLHGGGFVCGSVSGARGLISALAVAFGAPVFAVGYRQAPEHPFPAAIEDARKSYEWLRTSTQEPITLIGESAGASLAVGTALAVARNGDRRIRGVIGLSGWFDLSMSGASWHTNREADLVTFELGRFFRDCYLPGGDPRAIEVAQLSDDLRGLPPLLIQVGSRELALDDACALATKARAAGTRVQCEMYTDVPHGFLKFTNPIGDLALRRMVEWEAAIERC